MIPPGWAVPMAARLAMRCTLWHHCTCVNQTHHIEPKPSANLRDHAERFRIYIVIKELITRMS